MDTNKKNLCILGLIIAVFAMGYFIGYKNIKINEVVYQHTDTIYVNSSAIDWDLLIEALSYIESNWNDSAIGKTNDVGYLQITPIVVKDCNRIVGYEKYSLNDRYSRDLSIEMFNVIQNNYNKDKDIHLALKIWNPYAPISYHNKVMNEYNKLNNYE